jgi:hypothetical protein
MRINEVEFWVVYQMMVHGRPTINKAVCTQTEWVVMERYRPGYFTLIQSGFPTENAAEIAARGTSGDLIRRESKPRWPVANASPGA